MRGLIWKSKGCAHEELIWQSKGCGLSPQGYSPWTSPAKRSKLA